MHSLYVNLRNLGYEQSPTMVRQKSEARRKAVLQYQLDIWQRDNEYRSVLRNSYTFSDEALRSFQRSSYICL